METEVSLIPRPSSVAQQPQAKSESLGQGFSSHLNPHSAPVLVQYLREEEKHQKSEFVTNVTSAVSHSNGLEASFHSFSHTTCMCRSTVRDQPQVDLDICGAGTSQPL